MEEKQNERTPSGTVSPPNVEQWMREYGNEILRIIYLYVGDFHTAEDIFQEVFLKAYQKYEGFREESSIKTWLTRIAINASKDYLKSAWKRHVEPISEELEQTLSTADEYEAVEEKIDGSKLKQAVMELPERYREVILCFFYQELSLEETAAALQVPIGTVKSRLSRAKEQLKMKQKGGQGIEG